MSFEMKQKWYCGNCMKEYEKEEDALYCCEDWKLRNGAITLRRK